MSEQDDILYPSIGPFILVHVAGLAVVWTGVTEKAITLCIILYFIRMFAICAGYHRYFSHRSYSTSRAFQFALAFLAQSSAQKSVLWWAANHRHHHLHSDTEDDVHSPRHSGFWYAHFGWIFSAKNDKVDLSKVPDLARFPELRLLHRFEKAPAAALALVAFSLDGWSGLVVGFLWSTVLLYHATFCINSLAHMHGRKRYVTGDDSRNNWLLALITLGEGWHNNHHAYPSSVRQGFQWWEFDPTFYLLALLRCTGLVWDFKCAPMSVVHNKRRLGAKTIERAAAELALTFHTVSGGSTKAENDALTLLVPTRDEIYCRAVGMFPQSPSMDAIVERAYGMILDAGHTRSAVLI